MKPRYHVRQDINAWLVIDRLAIKGHSDIVAHLATRKDARKRVSELNAEERRDRHTDQPTLGGETI